MINTKSLYIYVTQAQLDFRSTILYEYFYPKTIKCDRNSEKLI